MPSAEFAKALRGFLEIAQEVPGVIETASEMAKQARRASRGGEAAYRRTHGGRDVEPFDVGDIGTEIVDGFPDPRKGVTVMGRLAGIEYVTEKGEGVTLYQHQFGPRTRTHECPECGSHVRKGKVDISKLPILGFTWSERPSGLVVQRDQSDYHVTSRGIEG